MLRRKESGFTLVEVTIILLILVVLGGILLPTIERFIDLARIARVKEDVGMLAAIIELWKYDNCTRWFHTNGADNTYSDTNRVDMLIGDGNIPSTAAGLGAGVDAYWKQPYSAAATPIFVDTIANQLALGDPFAAGHPYPRPASLAIYACGFRGAYLSTPVNSDPWGNRYMVNVAFLGPMGARPFGAANQADFSSYNVFVLSAGPDQTVSTEWQVGTPPNGALGVVAQGDDVIAVVFGG